MKSSLDSELPKTISTLVNKEMKAVMAESARSSASPQIKTITNVKETIQVYSLCIMHIYVPTECG